MNGSEFLEALCIKIGKCQVVKKYQQASIQQKTVVISLQKLDSVVITQTQVLFSLYNLRH